MQIYSTTFSTIIKAGQYTYNLYQIIYIYAYVKLADANPILFDGIRIALAAFGLNMCRFNSMVHRSSCRRQLLAVQTVTLADMPMAPGRCCEQPPAAGKTGRKPITRPGMTSLPKASGLQVHLGMVNGSWKSHCELFRQTRYAVMHTLAVLKHVQPVSCLENWLRTNMECDHPQDIG